MSAITYAYEKNCNENRRNVRILTVADFISGSSMASTARWLDGFDGCDASTGLDCFNVWMASMASKFAMA